VTLRFHVVVPVRLRATAHAAHLARCLEALAACDPAPASVTVVDDGSAAPVVLPRSAPAGTTLHRIAPAGPAAARNAGARALRGRPPNDGADVHVFVDADILVPPHTFARLAAVLAAHPAAAAVWGTVTARHPDAGSGLTALVSRYKNATHRHFTRCQPRGDDGTGATRHLTSMLVAVRAPVFEDAGGFDARWDTVSVEDVELGRELHARGHAVRLDHTLEADHLHRFSLLDAVRNDLHKVRRHAATTLARRARGCPSVRVEAEGERRQVRYLLGVPLGAGALLALAAGRPGIAAGLTAALCAWERDLLRQIARDEGRATAVASVPLLVLERGVVTLALVAGGWDHVRGRGDRIRPGA
jgi:GT2 family glycosyltransferase